MCVKGMVCDSAVRAYFGRDVRTETTGKSQPRFRDRAVAGGMFRLWKISWEGKCYGNNTDHH